jgi:hypothetical protein
MSTLSLDLFLRPGEDTEVKQYRALQGLKETYQHFSRSRLYPDLADLIRLEESLHAVLASHDNLQAHLPQTISEVDVKKKLVILAAIEAPLPELSAVLEFISWALPRIHAAIEEGTTIFNFVDEHILIEEVGIMPMYNQEGYWFVPDMRNAVLHVLRYEVALFSSPQEKYRTLKTVHVESLEEGTVRHSPESVKLHLVEKYADLPNPATYRCDTDIDFPYLETFLPVAKRKLMARLAA